MFWWCAGKNEGGVQQWQHSRRGEGEGSGQEAESNVIRSNDVPPFPFVVYEYLYVIVVGFLVLVETRRVPNV